MSLRDCVMDAFEEILERMAFLYFEEMDNTSDPADSNRYKYVTEVSFSGVLTGKFNLFTSKELGDLIARNLLGIRDNDKLLEGTVEDAICEFTNMIMGRTMTLKFSTQEFELGIPVVKEFSGMLDGEASTLQISGMMEDHPCMLLLQYRSA